MNIMPLNPSIRKPVDRARIDIPKIMFAGMICFEVTDFTRSYGLEFQNITKSPKKVKKAKVISDCKDN